MPLATDLRARLAEAFSLEAPTPTRLVGRPQSGGGCFVVDWTAFHGPVGAREVKAALDAARAAKTGGFGTNPHVFLLAKAPPEPEAQHLAFASDARVLVAVGRYGYVQPVVSRQEVLVPAGVTPKDWPKIQDALLDRETVIVDKKGRTLGTPASVVADLPRVGKDGSPHEVAFRGALLRVRGRRQPLPIRGLRFHYHLEKRPLAAKSLGAALGALVDMWLYR